MNDKEQKKLMRKARILNDIYEGCMMFGGLAGGFALSALLMGGAAELTANLSIDEKAQAIYEMEEYKTFANEGFEYLQTKYSNGEIGEVEFNEGVEALYSIPEVIRFAENSSDKELNQFVESYKESKDFSEAAIKKGFPALGGMAAVGLAGAAVVGKTSKKARKEFEESGGTLDVQKSFGE